MTNVVLSIFLVVAPIMSMSQPANAGEGVSRPKIVYFLGQTDTETPWIHRVLTTAEAAAEDFGIDLEFIYSEHRYSAMLKALKERVEHGDPIDYMILVNHRGELFDVLNYLEQRQVNSFVMLSGLSEAEAEEAGQPRERLKHWIGQLLPNDELAGYDLAQELILKARSGKTTDRNIRLLGVTGSYSNKVTLDRVRGLKRAVDEHEDVELLQIVSGRWQGSVVSEKYPYLLQRYKQIDAVWSANDNMALGLLGMSSVYGKSADEAPPLILGGMDWVSPARTALRERKLDVSMGGHFIDVAYTLFLLKEYHEGRDFNEVLGTTNLHSALIPLDFKSVEEFDSYVADTSETSLHFNTDQNKLRKSVVEDKISILSFIEAQR